MAPLSRTFHNWLSWHAPHRRRFSLAALLVSSLLTTRSWGQAEFKEYQLKAVFLFNFAQFVDWPATAFSADESPLIIGILGEDPFGTVLDDTIRDELVGRRPLVVQRYRRIEEIATCHVLFISKSESARLETILSALKDRPVLTVSDADRAAQRGVMIRLLTEKKKIRLRINLDSAKMAGLTISSKLLRPAEIVSTLKD